MTNQPLSWMDFYRDSSTDMRGSIQYRNSTLPGLQPGYVVGPLQNKWTMGSMKGSSPLVLGLIGLGVGAIIFHFWLCWKIGKAFAPNKKQERKYGWIGIGVGTLGMGALTSIIRAIREIK